MAAKMGCFCAATLLPRACAYLAVPGEVGRRVGLRRVGMNRETGNVSFWVAAPLGVEAMDRRNFGIVAASLWHHGRWGGAESVIARRIFERHCAADGVVADLGSHVGYFTLLAAAHGCATRSAEIDADFVALLGLALRANGFDDAARHRVFTGAVPANHSLDAVAAGVRQILYAKVDLEGYEAAAVSTNASALNRTSFAYVECPFVAGDERICRTGSKCMTILGSLQRAGFRLSALVAASKGPGATGGFVPHGRLRALPGDLHEACLFLQSLGNVNDLYGDRPPVHDLHGILAADDSPVAAVAVDELGDARPDEDYVLTKISPADAREGVRVVGDAFIFDVQVYDRDTRQTTHWRIHARRAAFRETMVHRVCDVIDLDVNVCDILVSRVEDQIQHK